MHNVQITIRKILSASSGTINARRLTQNQLETLLIIAYLCIALISIVIAVYAIGASYLGRETLRSKWRKKKRREELERKMKELGPKADVEGIKEEIDRYEKEIIEIDDKLSYLNVWRAVIDPTICFVTALIIISYNIYADPIGALKSPFGSTLIGINDLLTFFSVIAIAAGVFFLVKTLFAIEWAASRIPLPEFKVTFENGLTRNRYRVEEVSAIKIDVENIGEEIAEDVKILVLFPPNFNVAGFVAVQPASSKYPDYKAAVLEIPSIHIGIDILFQDAISLTMPKELGLYEIPVEIYERKIVGPLTHKLNLEIYS